MGCFYWHGNFSAIKINAIKNNDYKLFCLSRHTRLDYFCGKPTDFALKKDVNSQITKPIGLIVSFMRR